MKVDIADSELDLGPTPRNGRRPKPVSAAKYAAQEAAVAKAALVHSAADLKSSLAISLDLRRWAKAYPKTTLGVAVVAGVAIAGGLLRRNNSSVAKDDLSLSGGEPKPGNSNSSAPPPISPVPRSQLAALIVPALFNLAKFLIETLVMAAIRSPVDPPAPPPAADDTQ